MDEKVNPINQNKILLLSRNTPVALVVGAAGFLGSHLSEKLLDKNIQVVGVDNFTTGQRNYLDKAIKNKNFHLIEAAADNLALDLPRLDYLFIVAGENWHIDRLLSLFLKTNCRSLLVSWIDLYGSKISESLQWFKDTESKLAKFAHQNHLNARILRLGPVFGPRMRFRYIDPLIQLIQAALTEEIQKDVTLEFSSRALYVSDACDLIVKSMLAGSTAQKIFDGVLPTPVKAAEIKQVLLDPVWYENKGFTPSELPPWPTPNLLKTIKFLNWQPRMNLVAALRNTLSYFKDQEIKVPKVGEEETMAAKEWQVEKKEQLTQFKTESIPSKKAFTKGIRLPSFSLPISRIYLILSILIILYGLIWPMLAISWGVWTFRSNLTQANNHLAKGEFEDSLKTINQAEGGVMEAQSIFDSLQPVGRMGIFEDLFEIADQLSNLANLSVSSARSTTLGMQALYQGLKAVTGELAEPPQDYFNVAQVELAAADESLARAQALIQDQQFILSVPAVVKPQLTSLESKLSDYHDLVRKGRASSLLLPEIIALEGTKNYLVLLQNNMELRPAGGFIGSFAQVAFAGGKLKKLEVGDVYAIDGNLKVHVEPPKEIKEDLGQKDWFLRDSNWEPDFPTSARQAAWFYTKETGERVAGVVALDISAVENLLNVVGALDLLDYNEKVTAENLFEKAVSHAEQGFFPGSQAKKTFLTAVTHQLLNKMFFLPQQNWPGIVQALGQALEGKHMSIYLDDPKLFSYLVSHNWTGALPRAADDEVGSFSDFLAPVEANLGANKANYYLERRYSLETVIGREGEIRHRLKINYLNRSPSDTFPAGKYKNRMRLYLPFGSKLTRALWGEINITKDVLNFVDYGRSGYSILVELAPKETKTLILDYDIPGKLPFKDGKTTYRLDIVKQAGTLKDPLEWTISYPINYQVVSGKSAQISPQEQTIQTDLSKDRSFEVTFTR